MDRMKRMIPLVLVAGLASFPALAEEADEDSKSLMSRGFEMFMDGLRQEMAPAMDDLKDMAEQVGPSMRSFLQEMGPALAGMMDQVKDWTRYYPPEMLPNGDIILRRRPDPEAPPVPEPGPETPDSTPTPEGGTDI